MRKTKSEASRQAEFVEAAGGVYERLRSWRKAHPQASFDEIAEAVRQERQVLFGQLLGELATQEEQSRVRQVVCAQCGGEMKGSGLRGRGGERSRGGGENRTGILHLPDLRRWAFSPWTAN